MDFLLFLGVHCLSDDEIKRCSQLGSVERSILKQTAQGYEARDACLRASWNLEKTYREQNPTELQFFMTIATLENRELIENGILVSGSINSSMSRAMKEMKKPAAKYRFSESAPSWLVPLLVRIVGKPFGTMPLLKIKPQGKKRRVCLTLLGAAVYDYLVTRNGNK